VIGVLGDAEGLVFPGDEEPVDRKRREDHGHADGGLDGCSDHRQDGDGRRQDDVDDGEEEVNLDIGEGLESIFAFLILLLSFIDCCIRIECIKYGTNYLTRKKK